MKQIIILLCVAFTTTACAPHNLDMPPPEQEQEQPITPNQPTGNSMKIIVGNKSFNVTLADNATAAALQAMLPMRVTMSEMNGNEKYYNLPKSLPTAARNQTRIENGDIMLFGSSTLVLFYESFTTSYSYTKIGKIDNPEELPATLGAGNVSVKIE